MVGAAVGAALLLGGCTAQLAGGALALTDSLTVVSWVSTTVSGKGLGEHALNLVTGRDCRFLEAARPPSVMVVMVQLEVAQAMVAQPGAMSLVSIAVQTYGAPRLVCTVPPDAFHPRPKVTSAVVRIDVHGQPAVDAPDIAAFFRVVRGGFAAPRKQLRNSLAQGLSLPRESVTAMLDRAALNPTQRPADLSLDDWSRLTRARDEPS